MTTSRIKIYLKKVLIAPTVLKTDGAIATSYSKLLSEEDLYLVGDGGGTQSIRIDDGISKYEVYAAALEEIERLENEVKRLNELLENK